MRSRPAATAVASSGLFSALGLALGLGLAACGTAENSAAPAAGPTSGAAPTSGIGLSLPSASPTGIYDDDLAHHPTTYGTLGPGYPTPSAPPPPASTFTPSPNAWADVRPPTGYRVTLVAADHDPTAAVTVASVRSWAAATRADLTVIMVRSPKDNLTDLASAINAEPDLVVTAGDSLVDAMALVTASAPQTRFLILGAEIAEPTSNVTAVEWNGAGYRGEGLGHTLTHDPASFTPERTGRAIRAGVAAVLTNWTNLVIWLR